MNCHSGRICFPSLPHTNNFRVFCKFAANAAIKFANYSLFKKKLYNDSFRLTMINSKQERKENGYHVSIFFFSSQNYKVEEPTQQNQELTLNSQMQPNLDVKLPGKLGLSSGEVCPVKRARVAPHGGGSRISEISNPSKFS